MVGVQFRNKLCKGHKELNIYSSKCAINLLRESAVYFSLKSLKLCLLNSFGAFASGKETDHWREEKWKS